MDKRGQITRRTLVGLGVVTALSLPLLPRFAWGGVGGGSWGSSGATAEPGSHFGYDAGWSYSFNGCVWLSASCNCTVGRMTELFLTIRVDAYVACGGIWHPTWSPDMPDTPTYAYVRDDSGTWLTAAYWNIDTTYDHDYYVYMTGASLRIPRRLEDWYCWCGADIKGLGGSAPGTHSIAEASQRIPHHVLVDDVWWKGKVVTIRPRAAEHLYVDSMGGATVEGTNIAGWSITHTTNQNWLVLASTQGHTCLVPVHTGTRPLFMDVKDAVWDDCANVQLWTGNGSSAQSLYLHNLGNGYHLLVFECSGCALDLEAGGQSDGTNLIQYNCYGAWGNVNQHMKFDEPVFRERTAGAMALLGKPEVGNVLRPTDPDVTCVPYNYPATSGLQHRYAWYRGFKSGMCTDLVQAAHETPGYTVTEADEGSYLTCVITAHTRYADVKYQGEVVTPSVRILPTKAMVRFFVDGEVDACYEDRPRRGMPYTVPDEAWQAAEKSDCSGVDGWYRDTTYVLAYENGMTVEEDFDLFAYNRVELAYAMTDRSFLNTAGRRFFLDKALTDPLPDREAALPKGVTVPHGERVTFARGVNVWFADKGRVREVACSPGAYADAQATGSSLRMARITRNTLVYLDWRTIAYDGIALS